MKYNLKTLETADVRGKKILLRAPYDITLAEENGNWIVPDDTRIRATLPTVDYLLQQGCSIGFLTYVRRPGGKIVEGMRTRPIAERLSELVNRPVKALTDCIGPEVQKEIEYMEPGDLVMLENVRFHSEEEAADPEFAKALCKGFEFIVYEGFAQAMRVHASTTGILQILPSCSGFLFQKEIETLSRLLENPQRPFVAVQGGAKISDRVGVLQTLIHKADKILIGGALANTFFSAQGLEVGKSKTEDVFVDASRGEKRDYKEIAKALLTEAGEKLQLPIDMLAALSLDSQGKIVNLDKNEALPSGWSYLDIGPRTIELYGRILKKAKTIFANGPMGLFEIEAFAGGTKKVAEAMIASGATTVLGGGDTESIVERYGWQGKFTHVSTGGGASLEFLAGKEFPVMRFLSLPRPGEGTRERSNS